MTTKRIKKAKKLRIKEVNDYEMIGQKNDNGFGIAPLGDWSGCISTGGAKKIVNSGVFDKKTSM